MQAKDIPDRQVLEFLAKQDKWALWSPTEGYGFSCIMDAFPEGTPAKVASAKMSKLIRRGLAAGCTCGCRGDFEITPAGRLYLVIG